MAALSVKIASLEMKNPVMTASGTFGYGLEFADLVALDEIGGIIVKGTTLKPREGNDYPRSIDERNRICSLCLYSLGNIHDVSNIWRKLHDKCLVVFLSVKPVAVRMVNQVAKGVKIPVVGLGGICTAEDAIEFLMAGATAIEIGTANFLDPTVTVKVKNGINDWLDAHGCASVQEIIGVV